MFIKVKAGHIIHRNGKIYKEGNLIEVEEIPTELINITTPIEDAGENTPASAVEEIPTEAEKEAKIENEKSHKNKRGKKNED